MELKYIFYLNINLNKLSLKYQSYPKSGKIDEFKQEICICHRNTHNSKTRCRPSMGRRCIPNVILKNKGSMMQTCRNINEHVVYTDIC